MGTESNFRFRISSRALSGAGEIARLHRDNLVRSEWVESVQGPPRKYYTLTAGGRQLYAELREDFDLLISLVKQDWGIRERPENTGKKILIRKR